MQEKEGAKMLKEFVELHPQWMYQGGRVVGVKFGCPHCTCTLAVAFENPPDGGPAAVNLVLGENAGKRWQRTGETLETLTLHPSVDAEGHWHGWVKAGKLA